MMLKFILIVTLLGIAQSLWGRFTTFGARIYGQQKGQGGLKKSLCTQHKATRRRTHKLFATSDESGGADIAESDIKIPNKAQSTDDVDKAIDNIIAPVVARELTPISALQVLKKTDKPIMQPNETSYIMCSSCKTAYVMSDNELGRRGLRVRCGVCDKEWYQSGERLMQSNSQNVLVNMTDDKVGDIRKAIAERNWPKYPRVDKIGIFVGNLPYDYTEKEIGDLFGEYGVTGISLVRDPTGLSKGFAFIELSNEKDVEVMIKEMHLFHVDGQRKLTVRVASNDPNRGPREPREPRPGGPGGRPQSGGGDRGGGGGGRGPGGPPTGRAWTPRK